MSKQLISYEKFENIMNVLLEFQQKRDKFSDFLEKEICTDSFCLVTFGNKLEETLTNLLADEFKCWYSFRKGEEVTYDWWNDRKSIENDIENFLYRINDEPLVIEVNKKEFRIETIRNLYDYLVFSYERSNEFDN